MDDLHVTRVIQLAECDHVLLAYFLFPLFDRSFFVLYVNFIICSNLKIALTLTPMFIRLSRLDAVFSNFRGKTGEMFSTPH